MEYKTIGKTRHYEMSSESDQNLLTRFIIHFLFVEHNHYHLELFDKNSSIFTYYSQNPTEKKSIQEVLSQLQSKIKKDI